MLQGFHLIFQVFLVINKGSEGPYLVKNVEVPKSSKNIAICPQALIIHLKPIFNHTNSKNTINIIKKSKEHANLLVW